MWVGRVAQIVKTNANLFKHYEFSPLKATESESIFPSNCPCIRKNTDFRRFPGLARLSF